MQAAAKCRGQVHDGLAVGLHGVSREGHARVVEARIPDALVAGVQGDLCAAALVAIGRAVEQNIRTYAKRWSSRPKGFDTLDSSRPDTLFRPLLNPRRRTPALRAGASVETRFA